MGRSFVRSMASTSSPASTSSNSRGVKVSRYLASCLECCSSSAIHRVMKILRLIVNKVATNLLTKHLDNKLIVGVNPVNIKQRSQHMNQNKGASKQTQNKAANNGAHNGPKNGPEAKQPAKQRSQQIDQNQTQNKAASNGPTTRVNQSSKQTETKQSSQQIVLKQSSKQ